MFYFNNNIEDMQKVLKQIFNSPTEEVMKRIVAWYAIENSEDSATVQECFIFFKINQTIPTDWKALEAELNSCVDGAKNASLEISVVSNRYPLYQIRVKATSRQMLMSRIVDSIIRSVFMSNNDVYDVSVIPRVTPKRDALLSSDQKPFISYVETRMYHLLKMLYLHPQEMMHGEIWLDMTKAESYEKLDSIVLFCLTKEADIKVSLNYTTITERVNICKALHNKFVQGGMYISYQKIQDMLINLPTKFYVESDGTIVNI